jgi:hypothetical protein
MELTRDVLSIAITFDPDDLAQIQRDGATIPPYWQGHQTPPALGDVLRFGQWQCAVSGRAWEHDGTLPVLRLYMTRLQPRSDTLLN